MSKLKKARAFQLTYLAQIRKAFGDEAFRTLIPDHAEFERSVDVRIPITFYSPRSHAAVIGRHIFDEVEARQEQPGTYAEKSTDSFQPDVSASLTVTDQGESDNAIVHLASPPSRASVPGECGAESPCDCGKDSCGCKEMNAVPYNVNMTPFAGLAGGTAGSRDLGQELDVIATYQISPRMNLLFGYSHFFAGDFYATTLGVPYNGDADFIYTQFHVNF